ELAPPEDQSIVFGIIESSADATIDQVAFYAHKLNDELMKVPEQGQTFQLTYPDRAFSGLVLKPWEQRKRTVFQVAPDVQAKVSKIPGIRAFVATPPSLPGGGQFPVEVVFGSTADPEIILDFVRAIQLKCATNGMFAFPPQIDTKLDQPEMELVMDRDKVASLGLNMATVGSDLSTLVGGNFVNRFNFGGRSYKVIPQLSRMQRLNASQLEDTYVKGPNGQTIPLSTFATLRKKVGPRTLNRFQQFNSV